VQGERDRYGNADAVRSELVIHQVSATVLEVANADHSYCNNERVPIYQTEVINLLMTHV
jgi:predicted alpha/beta-hydrolase family hydrolase